MVVYQDDFYGLTRKQAEFSEAGECSNRADKIATGKETHGEQ